MVSDERHILQWREVTINLYLMTKFQFYIRKYRNVYSSTLEKKWPKFTIVYNKKPATYWMIFGVKCFTLYRYINVKSIKIRDVTLRNDPNLLKGSLH